MLSFEHCRRPVTIVNGTTVSCDNELLSKLSMYNSPRYTVLPGFCDVHVHFREPGFSYKETIYTGCKAAAHGGYTAVCTMPNLNPVPDSISNLSIQQNIIQRDAMISVYPYGSITKGELGTELSDMIDLSTSVVAFSDDGKGIQDAALMKKAMSLAAQQGKIIAAHCEDNSLLNGGYINDGEYAKIHTHKGISGESEWRQVERDLNLACQTNCSYHVCHISTKESVYLIREAKKSGINVSCETAPHYLVLDENALQENGCFKMNPPLRCPSDREAIIDGLLDGTIDMIATDHAPHSIEEKSKGLQGSLFGIVGLETAFPILYTNLVLTGIIPFELLINKLSESPGNRFRIPFKNDFSIWDLSCTYNIDSKKFYSKGNATPFEGSFVNGRCLLTVHNGSVVYCA